MIESLTASISENLHMIESMVRDFGAKEMTPHIMEWDEKQHFPLDLLKKFKAQHPDIPTKSGIMVGLGETYEQVQETLQHLADHDVEMITIGQYLQPTQGHHPVLNYWTPD